MGWIFELMPFIKCWKKPITRVLKQKVTWNLFYPESHHLALFETINNAQKSWIQQVYSLPNVLNHIHNNYIKQTIWLTAWYIVSEVLTLFWSMFTHYRWVLFQGYSWLAGIHDFWFLQFQPKSLHQLLSIVNVLITSTVLYSSSGHIYIQHCGILLKYNNQVS